MDKVLGSRSGSDILQGFCDCVESGEDIPPLIREFLHDAFFSHLYEGTPIAKALRLTRPAHRPTSHETTRKRLAVAALYWILDTRDIRKEDAKLAVRDTLGLSTRTLESYDKELSRYRKASVSSLEKIVDRSERRQHLEEAIKQYPHRKVPRKFDYPWQKSIAFRK